MKILILYTYNKGYLSNFFFELSSKLVKDGHEVYNFSWKNEPQLFSINGIQLIIKKKGGYINKYHQVYKILKEVQPDIVLSNFSYVNPALLFGKLLGVRKNSVWFHSLNDQMEPSKLNIFIKKQFLRMADVIVANSFLTKKELQSIYEVPNYKLKTIPFWSDIQKQNRHITTSNYELDRPALKIGCPGRMAHHKNHRIAIEAVAKLKSLNSYGCHLYIAGDGEELTALKSFSKDLDLINEVSYLGHLSSVEMINFYKDMDVVVLPSLHEAFGLVFIEAIALGTPVIVSSQFGALHFIDAKTFSIHDFTFDPSSVSDLTGKLLPYLEQRGIAGSYFENLYQMTFNKDVIYNQIKAILINP